MTVLPACFNFYYATKYRILLQTEQKEYVISFITLITTSLGYMTSIIAMPLGCSMWFVRFSTMFFSLINSFVIGFYVRRHFPHIDYNAQPDFKAIKGTRDVFAQKLTGVFYSTAPIVCVTLTAGGTMLASVYAVYNSVFVLLKGIMHAVIDAPRLGLGELAAQGNKERVWKIYEQYEMIVTIMLFVFLSTAAVMIMPFIGVYTHGVTDIDYHQPLIALMLVLICCFEFPDIQEHPDRRHLYHDCRLCPLAAVQMGDLRDSRNRTAHRCQPVCHGGRLCPHQIFSEKTARVFQDQHPVLPARRRDNGSGAAGHPAGRQLCRLLSPDGCRICCQPRDCRRRRLFVQPGLYETDLEVPPVLYSEK